MILPSGDIGTVRSLERDSQACSIARAGDNVAVTLQNIDANVVISGGVLCHPDFPVSVTNHLELKILVLDVQTPVLIGSQVLFIGKDINAPLPSQTYILFIIYT